MKQKHYIYNKTGTRQLIDSGWKEFDKQTNLIIAGNAYCNTQYSSFIRPWKATECNGRTNPEGHLLDYDLSSFKRYQIPNGIMKILKDKERVESVILYMFFVRDKQNRIQPFCWTVTDRNYKLVKSTVIVGYGQCYEKRLSAANEANSYICE